MHGNSCAYAGGGLTLGGVIGEGGVGEALAGLGQEWGERHGQHHHDDQQPVQVRGQHLELVCQAQQHKRKLAPLAQQERRPDALLPARPQRLLLRADSCTRTQRAGALFGWSICALSANVIKICLNTWAPDSGQTLTPEHGMLGPLGECACAVNIETRRCQPAEAKEGRE